MGKLEDLIEKRNLELEQERKAILAEQEQERKAKLAEQERKEYENELALKEKQRTEAIARTNNINFSESVALGLLYGLIGAVAGMVVIGVILWILLLIILGIFGSKMDSDSILNLSGAIGLIVGALVGYSVGFYSKRQ